MIVLQYSLVWVDFGPRLLQFWLVFASLFVLSAVRFTAVFSVWNNVSQCTSQSLFLHAFYFFILIFLVTTCNFCSLPVLVSPRILFQVPSTSVTINLGVWSVIKGHETITLIAVANGYIYGLIYNQYNSKHGPICPAFI